MNFLIGLEKHHTQYPEIQVKAFSQSHDRFLLIDGKELYHLGLHSKTWVKNGLHSIYPKKMG
ncbi:hypothetical protein [Algoriphagus boritolerans]|uniref:hypothetical protein n=1 Tax=Algoriphagus boritolerans TaxID=308111 RepID=UPI00190ED1FC|nr:hypothetical protein [Algoriphagus boritolerans]